MSSNTHLTEIQYFPDTGEEGLPSPWQLAELEVVPPHQPTRRKGDDYRWAKWLTLHVVEH